MNKRVTALSVTILVVFAAATWAEQRPLGAPAPRLEIDFLQGEPFDLKTGVGENFYIIEFWATWCGPCRQSIPHLSNLYEKYKSRGLKVVGVSDESADLVRPYMNEMGDKMSYTVAIDPEAKTTRRYFNAYGISGIPTAFLVDTRGNVVWYGHPMDRMMEQMILALAKQKDAIRAARSTNRPRASVSRVSPSRSQGRRSSSGSDSKR